MPARVAGLTLVVVALAGALLVAGSGRALSQGTNGGVTVTVSPLSGGELTVEVVSVEPAGNIEQGSRFRVTVAVTNTGSEQLRQGKVTLLVGDGLTIVGPESRNFGTLNGFHTKLRRWNVRADDEATFGIMATATAVLGEEQLHAESSTFTVSVVSASTASITTTSATSARTSTTATTVTSATSAGVASDLDPPATPGVLEVQIVDVITVDGGADGPLILVTASVANVGGRPLDGVTATLHFDSSGLAVVGDATQIVGALEPDESAQLRWELRVGEPGLYALTIEAAAATRGGAPPLSGDDTAIVRAAR